MNSFMNVEIKDTSKQWTHTHSPKKPREFKQNLSGRKLMTTVFWDRKGLLMAGFMQKGTTIMSEVYCVRNTKKRLRIAIENKRCGMLTSGVILLHDNARPHTAARTRALLEYFNWELFDRPPYSPDLAPSDYELFTYANNWL
jgi:histone-lysine N-methyltransferase SETMAR